MDIRIMSSGIGLQTYVTDTETSLFMGGIESIGWDMEDPYGDTLFVIERVKLRDPKDVLPGESHAVRHPDGSLDRERITIRAPMVSMHVAGNVEIEDIP